MKNGSSPGPDGLPAELSEQEVLAALKSMKNCSSPGPDGLPAELSEQEVLAALKSMKNGSSPGPDSLPAEFYKVFWVDIKDMLMDCIIFSFNTGSQPNTMPGNNQFII
ncbi:retrotransposon protein, putative, unclassified [Elysia marginata]|uniref:Retrotransposon protein, putative, unclassified n=1 Tax=Elysia marginata TaxID=1093978 RepID=A0AAV4IVQ3_9GAST|nr:retrotransposon protein, putative, unclassified [Elysia marginata]